MTVLWVIAIIGIAFLLLLILRIQLEVKIIVKNGKNFSFVIVRLLRGLLRARINLSLKSGTKNPYAIVLKKTDSSLKKETSPEQALRIVLHMSQQYTKYRCQINYFKSKIAMANFSVRTRVGVGDAAATALVTSGFYTIFQIVIQHLDLRYHLQNRKMIVLPYFEGSVFDLDLDCIINFKFGHIMITGMKMLIQKIKGGENGG